MVKFIMFSINAHRCAGVHTRMRRCVSAALALAGGVAALAAAEGDPVQLPDFWVRSARIANQVPSGTMDMPVSALRFEPRVDVQARNLAEAQADVTIRGGIFENTGFRLGALPLGDPQTGHYFAEIPVPPRMLGPVQVQTGAENAIVGFNASVGTVSYTWRPIVAGGHAAVAVGDNRFNRQSLYLAATRARAAADASVGVDVELARSASDGSIPFGDHDFERGGVRLQLRQAHSQTDFFAGYQAKFFGWPNLYAPPSVSSRESENLQTLLLAANHRWHQPGGDEIELGIFHRRHKDDYEFNRFAPNAAFEHTTWLYGASVDGRKVFGDAALRYGLHATSDDLRSTALRHGRYMSRTTFKATIVPEWTRPLADGAALLLQAGASYEATNRHSSAVSPVVAAAWQRGTERFYVEYAEATQLPTYTALNSSATAGLFRGNRDLGRSRSRNLEAGFQRDFGPVQVTTALFYRFDDELVDWTFPGVRTATAMDIDTVGVELIAAYRSPRFDAVLGYTWLEKDADYRAIAAAGSYYALNFPRHRLTAALTWRLGGGFEFRFDNEFRDQARNVLRTTGDRAWISAAGVYYLPPRLRGWEFSAVADNLWDDDFQEVPGVPASRRQLSFGVARRW